MRILFITDPLETFKTYKDSTYAMMAEAAARGHELYWCLQPQLALSGRTVETVATRLHLTGEDGAEHGAWYREGNSALEPLSAFDAVLMRKDPPFDMEYVYGTYLLEQAERQGARVFNKPQAIRDHNEKLSIAQFSQLKSHTLVSSSGTRLSACHAEHGDVIFKPLDGL